MKQTEVEQCCGGRKCPLEEKPMLWSILVCTITERQPQFAQLTNELMRQIKLNGFENEVEVIYLCDSMRDPNRLKIGAKRNQLVNSANGRYICFIDDDDSVSPDYVSSVHQALRKDPDVVGINGIITFNGGNPCTFVHSIKYKVYSEGRKVYYRPPNHLNPVKKELAIQVPFNDKNFGEDTEWALSMVERGLLKKEQLIMHPIYYYKYIVKPKYI